MYAGRPPGIPVYPWKKQTHGGTARSVWTACSWHPSFQRREDSRGYKLQVWTAAEVGACIWLIFVTGALFWHHIPHGWQVHELHKKNRGSQPCSFHHPNNFWSHLSTLYMLLSCCLKRWSRLQAGFFLLGSTTRPREHRLSTPAIQDLSSWVSFSPILSGCCEKLYSSTLLLHRAVSRRCKPAFG